jgi:signal peptidase I
MNPGPVSPQQDPPAASAPSDAADASGRRDHPRKGPSWLLLVVVALVVMMLVRGFLVQSFYVPSESMQPTIEPGDRILVNKLVSAESLQRGDIVVFDGTTTFAVADRTPAESDGLIGRVVGGAAALVGVKLGEQDFVKRVIGLPGDHVVCCDAQGRLTVNGHSLDEPYLYPGDKASDLTFDIIVPKGRLWVMGDHRSDSSDSRAHLGDPGGGTVRFDDVIGRAFARYWPLSRLGGFDTPSSLADVPRAAAP